MKYSFCFLFFMLAGLSATFAQEQRFEGSLIAGLNAAQINGDDLYGYDKLGVRAGLQVAARLGKKSSLGLGILYSQRGSSSTLTPDNSLPRRLVQLNYVEMPVLFSFSDWYEDKGDFYHLAFQGGLVYSRLISSRVEFFPPFDTEKENFAKNDLSFSLGATYYVNPHWGFSAYYTRSVFLLYDRDKHLNDNGAPIYASSMLGFFLSFQTVYRF